MPEQPYESFSATDYCQIAGLLSRLADSLAGSTPPDVRLVDSHALTLKLLLHAATAYQLARGTDVRPFLATPGVILDQSSLAAVARAALESYLTFYYIFVDSEVGDEFEFRHSAWMLSGFVQRETFPTQLPEHRERQAADVQENQRLRHKIMQTVAFKSLKPRQQKAVLDRGTWRFESWTSIAPRAGLARRYTTMMYSLLSSHAHSDGLSATQVQQTPPEGYLYIVQGLLSFITVIVAKMIFSLAHLFPAAQGALHRSPETAKRALTYARAMQFDLPPATTAPGICAATEEDVE